MQLKVLEERVKGDRCCQTDAVPRLTDANARDLANDFDILAHPVRLQLLDLLARNEGQVCVCDLEAAVPVKQPTVSHHLRLLREANLIGFEKRGLWTYYFVNRKQLSALRSRMVAQLDGLRSGKVSSI